MKVISDIFDYFLVKKYSKIFTIEIVEIEERISCISVLVIKCRKSNVIIDKEYTFDDILAFNDWYVKQTPLPTLLYINSDRVVNKYQSNAISDIESIYNTEEYYTEAVPFGHESSFYSIIRKNVFDAIIGNCTAMYSKVIFVTISPFHVLSYHKLLYEPIADSSYCIKAGSLWYSVKDDVILAEESEVQTTHSKRLVIALSEVHTVLFSIGLLFFSSPFSVNAVAWKVATENAKSYKKNFSAVLICMALISLTFVSLIISNILNTYYTSRVEQLISEKSFLENSLSKEIVVNKRKTNITNIETEISIANDWPITYCADQITSILPDDVYLSELNINPVLTTGIDSKFEFNSSAILLSGNCYSEKELNDFTEALKGLQWVKSVRILFYHNDNTIIGSFSVEIIKSKMVRQYVEKY